MLNRWLFVHFATETRWRQRGLQELAALEKCLVRGLTTDLARLQRALRDGDAGRAIRSLQEVEQMLEVARAIPDLATEVRQVLAPPEASATATVPTYWISSATLAMAHAYLTQRLPGSLREPEWMLAATGLRRDQLYTLEYLIEVKIAKQSGAQAAFDMQDFTRVAVTLHEHGQALHAIFHSHRFAGAPHPSGTDMRLQKVLEEGGYPTIQAVFSEDGYVRFFAGQRRFNVEVYGKGVRQIDEEGFLYRIVHFGTLQHPRPGAAAAGRSAGG